MPLKKRNPKIEKIEEAVGNPSYSKEFISEMPVLDDTVLPGFGKPQEIAKGGLLSKHNFAGAGGGLGRLHKSMSIKKLRMF